MAGSFSLEAAQGYLQQNQLDGWLLEDFQHSNPIFWQVIGSRRHTTRRAFLLIPPAGVPRFLLHMIDAERLSDLGWPIDVYLSRADQQSGLRALLRGRQRLAMEYSPACSLPVVSRVDAGTIEEVRALGVDVVSSGDVLQYAVARWSPDQVASHRVAADAVVAIAGEAFAYIGQRAQSGVTEFSVRGFIQQRFAALDLITDAGPDVAVNAHSSDPHYEPTAAASSPIRGGDWVLIDLWAKQPGPNAVYGDTTWVGYVGTNVPVLYQRVFDSVRRARDAAIRFLEEAWQQGRELEGWQVDEAARQLIAADGFAEYFTHRLGHSLGEEIHSNGVNLDSFETHDTRQIIPGVGFTIEPGIYLPEFGTRLEVDVYVDPAHGPTVTSPVQREIVIIS
ncbi:MAG TPA: M24 family metallopeptidase [Chloroflexota bacterium]|nr:M24 family metallopeptidase [Chloroflexota bacterium]